MIETTGTDSLRRWLRKVALAARLFFSLIAGLLFGTAGGAVYPPLLQVAAPLICDGRLETVSSRFSYKPGQVTTAHEIHCLEADGTDDVVTFKAVFLSTLLYAVGLFILWPLLTAPIRYLWRRIAT